MTGRIEGLRGKLRRGARVIRRRAGDLWRSTYTPVAAPRVLYRYFPPPPIDELRADSDTLAAVTGLFLEHRFDLLGSGWVHVEHGMRCAGVEGSRYESGPAVRADPEGRWLAGRVNAANLPTARRVWRMIDPGYRPIDWHLDFKSGFRWSESTWWRNVPVAHLPGVDVKVPWELARMQHLPQLASAHALARAGVEGFEAPERYAREFRNQVLDFVATNPPRYGVNWRMPMDVAIRAASWLVAHDLFRARGVEFDAGFEAVFQASLHDHGRFVVDYLEWHPTVRGNHYLANVVGLLFLGAYLPRSRRTDAWLAFAVRELEREGARQFTRDGANFESSTAYHRLSAEMVVFGTALVLALPEEKRAALREYDPSAERFPDPLGPPTLSRDPVLPPAHYERIRRMAKFTIDVTGPDGRVIQVGDNDNGRFLKLHPPYRSLPLEEVLHALASLEGYRPRPGDTVYRDEEHLDHRDLISIVDALLPDPERARFAAKRPAEGAMLRGLLANAPRPVAVAPATPPGPNPARADDSAFPAESRVVTEIPLGSAELPGEPALRAYPDFGIYLYRATRFFLSIRCGGTGQIVTEGHLHLDQLSLELWVDGEPWIVDPGTYVYTALPARRNRYRSAEAHFGPRLEPPAEWGDLGRNLFVVGDPRRARCVAFDERGFVGEVQLSAGTLRRSVQPRPGLLRIVDEWRPAEGSGGGARVAGWRGAGVEVSPGYGALLRRPSVTLPAGTRIAPAEGSD